MWVQLHIKGLDKQKNRVKESPLFKKRFYLFIFREGKGGRERGRETSMCSCFSCTPTHNQGPTHNPGMCRDLESNWQPLDSKASTQSLSHTCQGKKVLFTPNPLPLSKYRHKNFRVIPPFCALLWHITPQHIDVFINQEASTEVQCSEFLLGFHYVITTDWIISQGSELNLQLPSLPCMPEGWADTT